MPSTICAETRSTRSGAAFSPYSKVEERLIPTVRIHDTLDAHPLAEFSTAELLEAAVAREHARFNFETAIADDDASASALDEEEEEEFDEVPPHLRRMRGGSSVVADSGILDCWGSRPWKTADLAPPKGGQALDPRHSDAVGASCPSACAVAVDPGACDHVAEVNHVGRSIVITGGSLDECEARLAELQREAVEHGRAASARLSPPPIYSPVPKARPLKRAAVLNHTPTKRPRAIDIPRAAAPSGSTATEPLSRKARKNQAAHARRARRAEAQTIFEYTPPASLKKLQDVFALETDLTAASLPATNAAYVGRAQPAQTRACRTVSLEDAQARDGASLLEWPDRYKTHLVLDKDLSIIAACVGQAAATDEWDDVCARACTTLKHAVNIARFAPAQLKNRRFSKPTKTMTFGISFGNGQQHPRNLKVQKGHEEALALLLADPDIQRLMGYGSSALASWAPSVFGHYRDVLEPVLENDPGLQMPFESSIFAAVTFNMDTTIETALHTDNRNFAGGYCAIHSLGDFDYRKGGHLYLPDLRLLLEFPPNSTILIPSAVLTHGNTTIQAGETRQSITQFFAGSLSRWHRCEGRTVADWKREDSGRSRAFLSELKGEEKDAWKRVLKLWSTPQTLAKDRLDIFSK